MVLPGFEWSLPCEGRLEKEPENAAPQQMLRGSVSQCDIDQDFGNSVDRMLDAALFATTKMHMLEKAVAHYRTPAQKTIKNIKKAANYSTSYRGFASSSEAADIILDEKIKVKDEDSADYARQRYIDEMHPKVIARTMQLSLALGAADTARKEQLTASAMSSLRQLVGDAEANLARQQLSGWAKEIQVPESMYDQESWDVESFGAKLKDVTKLAMKGDPVVQELIEELRSYNHHSKLSQFSSKVIGSGLNIATWAAPGFFLPAACELANVGYVMATGGPEEDKLLTELYYDKRVESRYRAINEEAQLALSQYQNALHDRNPVLLMCCESVLAQLVGAENMDCVVARTLLTHKIVAQHTLEATANSDKTLR